MARKSGKAAEGNPYEWAIAAVSSLIVLGLVGILAFDAVAGTDEPATVAITAATPREDNQGRWLDIVAHNTGDRSAESVEIVLGSESSVVARAVIDIIPPRSRREASLALPDGVDAASAVPRIVGFATP